MDKYNDTMKDMPQINATIDEEILRDFRDVVYKTMGLKKGDIKKAIEKAMLDYIQKYSSSESAKQAAKRAQDHLAKG